MQAVVTRRFHEDLGKVLLDPRIRLMLVGVYAAENTMLNDGHLELIGKMKNLYFLELCTMGCYLDKCNLIPDHFKTLAKSAVFNLEHFFFGIHLFNQITPRSKQGSMTSLSARPT